MPTGLDGEIGPGTAPLLSPLSSEGQLEPKAGRYQSFLNSGKNILATGDANQFQFLQSRDGLLNIQESDMAPFGDE